MSFGENILCQVFPRNLAGKARIIFNLVLKISGGMYQGFFHMFCYILFRLHEIPSSADKKI